MEDVFYKPHWSGFDEDGTIHLRASVWDDEGHSSVVREIAPSEEDYPFWQWIMTQERFAKVLNEQEVATARAEFEAQGRAAAGPDPV